MEKFNKVSVVVLFAGLIMGLSGWTSVSAATVPNLGIAETYAIWGKSGVSNTGAPTHIWGNVGADLLSNITGLIGSQVDGTMSGPVPGLQTDATAAYTALNAWGADGTKNLSTPQTVTPGVWTVDATQTFTGTTILDGAGVYIFRSNGAYTFANGATLSLINGADACNVFWQIPGITTIGTTAHVEGTIITNSGNITLANSATLKGRALSLVASVTLDSNQITNPCATVAAGGSAPSYYTTVPLLLPLINVTKIPDPLNLPSGPGSVTYTYTATNIGEVAMSNVWVKDNKCSTVEFISGDGNGDSKLDMDEAWIYRCTKTVSLTETNTATAHGAANNGEVWDTANATVVVGLDLLPPLIHLVKVPNLFSLLAGGGAVTYSYTVTNPGTAPLNNVSVIDDKCTGLPGRVLGHPGDLNQNNLLESNETWHFTCQTNIWQTTTNIGTAQGSANGLTAIDFAPATVVVALPSFPSTAIGFDEKNISWAIATLAGILVVSAALYFVRKKQIKL